MKEKGTVAEEATDETLSQAWDNATGKEEVAATEVETKPETITEETPPAEKPASAETQEAPKEEVIDHKESSHLGRKLKGLESKFEQILARLDQTTKPAEKKEQIEVPEVVTTPDDVETVINAREERARQARAQYESNYLKQIDSLKAADDSLEVVTHDEVVAELMTPKFNVVYDPGNPFADARVNYAEAKAFVLAKKVAGAKPRVPARETAEKQPIQPAASASRTTAKTFSMPKLDPEAESYRKYLIGKGMSDEDIAKELA